MSAPDAIETHYTRPQLEDVILQALARAGKDLEQLAAADLAPVDEFHVGGLQATETLAGLMHLRPGLRLLDVGCGIGGPARYFAEVHGCHVTGVDLTEEFVRVAQGLTRRVKLESAASFERASVLELPFAAASFDGAYMIHVGMNIADKASVFLEVSRVLKPGARFAIFDIMRAAPEPFSFPVPWALSAENSFVADAKAYLGALQSAGFTVKHERSRRQFAIEFTQEVMARTAKSGSPALGLHLLMGEKAPLMLKNVLTAMQAGILEPVELVGEKN